MCKHGDMLSKRVLIGRGLDQAESLHSSSLFNFEGVLTNSIVGVDCDEVPPVPIPNTEVKLIGAEDTWLEAARENRLMPTPAIPFRILRLYSSLAQSVEHAAVNRRVVRSSRTGGAKAPSAVHSGLFLLHFLC